MTMTPNELRIIDLAIEEDLGRGDITTRLTVSPSDGIRGRVIARQNMVVSGGEVFKAVMKRVDENTDVQIFYEDGKSALEGDCLLEVTGAASSLLMAERVALNFMQRLSGVATLTKQFVDALPDDSLAIITDTRKTTPGMRSLERRAVLDGGGRNHRPDLGGGVLIKENHIASAGSVEGAVKRAKSGAPHPLRIEVEVRSEDEVKKAIEAGADIVLLDNMSIEQLTRCVSIAGGRVVIEASGGVSLSTVASIARTGVDVISVGALTHSAPSADISFLLDGV